ncbi:nucleotide exchange factor GrpE [bacterium]|nr:nucleotide exchange factor GrpE [bacterium]
MASEEPKDSTATPEAGGDPAPPSSAGLAAELEAQRAETEKFRDLYLRERAEFENYKKRIHRDHAEAVRYAAAHLTRDLADVIDNLERAVEHAQGGGNGQPLVEGVRLVLQGALDALARHGITRIEAAGEAFDPTRHEAVASEHVPDTEPNRVVRQFLPGYALHDRVVRPAKVSVSARGPVESPKDDD